MDRRQFIFSAACATAGVVSGATDEKKAVTGGGVVYSRSLPVECEVDVFVAGGGPAGVAAAVAAARGGAKVFLAEATGAFGGAATAAYVPAFACFSDGKRLVVGGIGGEIRNRVSQGVPLTVDWAPLDLEELKRVYDAMVTKAGVLFSFFTNVVDVGVRDGHVEHVVLSSKRGLVSASAGEDYFFSRFGTAATDSGTDGYKPLLGKPSNWGAHSFSLNRNVFSLDKWNYTLTTPDFQCDCSAYVFATQNSANTPTAAHQSIMDLYSLQIWDDGVLVRDFVPCVKVEGETETVGLYDLAPKATKRFYENGATGAPLVAGPATPLLKDSGLALILR